MKVLMGKWSNMIQQKGDFRANMSKPRFITEKYHFFLDRIYK
jgi:hypothetical protein